MDAAEIIDQLGLEPHPEGGWYRQTWVDDSAEGRPAGTAIYYLLERGQRSHWHKVDATEIWHFHAGAPLALRLSASDTGPASAATLGPNLMEGQTPQVIVPKEHWQSAESLGDWTLVGCTVSPGFRFEGFTLAPPGFDIPVAPGHPD
jgi:predicted cupin superfamily sugar epimerase